MLCNSRSFNLSHHYSLIEAGHSTANLSRFTSRNVNITTASWLALEHHTHIFLGPMSHSLNLVART